MPSSSFYPLMLLGVALAGGAGSMIRLALSHWHGRLPWGILLGNSLASMVVGFGTVLAQSGKPGASLATAIIATGFAGGLSTFSSWAAQTVHLFSQQDRRGGLSNLGLNLVLPVIGVLLGLFFGALLLK